MLILSVESSVPSERTDSFDVKDPPFSAFRVFDILRHDEIAISLAFLLFGLLVSQIKQTSTKREFLYVQRLQFHFSSSSLDIASLLIPNKIKTQVKNAAYLRNRNNA